MQRIGHCYGAGDWGLMQAVLEAHGFHPRFEDRAMALTITDCTTALGGVTVHLPTNEAEDAAALLADFPAAVSYRPSLAAMMFIVIAMLVYAVPPTANGTYLRRPVATRDSAATG
jgi:hypothetical protein